MSIEGSFPFGPPCQAVPDAFCPPSLFEKGDDGNLKWLLASAQDPDTAAVTFTEANSWAIHGAANAGLAVYLYLDQLEKGAVSPKPEFNHCEQIKKH